MHLRYKRHMNHSLTLVLSLCKIVHVDFKRYSWSIFRSHRLYVSQVFIHRAARRDSTCLRMVEKALCVVEWRLVQSCQLDSRSIGIEIWHSYLIVCDRLGEQLLGGSLGQKFKVILVWV